MGDNVDNWKEKYPAKWGDQPTEGPADSTAPTLEAFYAKYPATYNTQIAKQGAKSREIAAGNDVNSLKDPRTYAAVSGALGAPPDEQGFSVLHPDAEAIRKSGEVGFKVGTLAQIAPLVRGVGMRAATLPSSKLGPRRQGQSGYIGGTNAVDAATPEERKAQNAARLITMGERAVDPETAKMSVIPKEVVQHRDTGWFEGGDGRLRREWADSEAQETLSGRFTPGIKARIELPLEEVWKHPTLYRNYPDMKGYKVVLDPNHKFPQEGGGFLNAETKEIYINPDQLGNSRAIRQILAHETDHGVGSIEKFGNSGADDATLTKTFGKDDGERRYYRASGEAAGNSQAKRLDMNDAERRQIFPLGMRQTGVPYKDLLWSDEAVYGNAPNNGAIVASSGQIPKEPAPIPLSEALDPETHTLKTLERLPQKKGVIPISMIQEQLRRPDISKAEKDILNAVMLKAENGSIRAEDLVAGAKAETENFRLSPEPTSRYANYGLDRISGNSSAARTTIWKAPEGVVDRTDNHFTEPRYFGHSRVFYDNGIPHVVEVQSDLMQKPAEVALPKGTRDLYEQRRAEWSNAHLNLKTLADGLLYSRRSRKETLEVMDHLKTSMPHDVQLEFEKAQIENANFMAERHPLSDQRADRFLYRILEGLVDQADVKKAEYASKLAGKSSTEKLEPMRKNWERRLINEEIGTAAKEGQTKIRFADADTIAKVEGWQDEFEAIHTEQWLLKNQLKTLEGSVAEGYAPAIERAKLLNQQLARLYDQEAASRKYLAKGWEPEDAGNETRALAGGDLTADEKFYKEHENDPPGTPLFSPQHHGIYSRYKKEYENYLKSLGATEHIDSSGHRWLEVPIKKGQRTPMFQMTGAPLATGAGAGYNANQQEPRK